MARAAEELAAAWQALQHGSEDAPGWRSIVLGSGGRLRAGILFPERSESLIVGFEVKRKLNLAELPSGRGFVVQLVQAAGLDANRSWFSLTRRDGADIGLFLTMACDVIDSITGPAAPQEEFGLQTMFLQRIRAWQRFMERSGGLDRETETGLHGELVVLGHLLEAGCPLADAVAAWRGPLDELHDFVLGSVALEVKTTIARAGFPISISSLEQLDIPRAARLFVVGVRLCEQEGGQTLPERIAEMRTRLAAVPSARQAFDTRILAAGYADSDTDHFSRRLIYLERRNIEVVEDFPRLARRLTPPAIREAKYVLDLDLVATAKIEGDELNAILGLQS